jgi:hypothetical protein
VPGSAEGPARERLVARLVDGLRPLPLDRAERARLDEVVDESTWRRWGPYCSDRAWGTVREDYSADGNAWQYLPYQRAHQKAYRWGEDGIGAICDRYQLLCFAPAFWNGQDSHLKERFYRFSKVGTERITLGRVCICPDCCIDLHHRC